MSDARELLEQTLRVNHPSIARRLGDALRELLDLCDIAEAGNPYKLTMSAAFVRAAIARKLAGETDE